MFSRFIPVLAKLKALKTHGKLMWHAFRHKSTPLWIKALMVAVVVYLISPIDVVPDFLLWFGITDDLIVITVAVWLIGKFLPHEVKQAASVQIARPEG